MKGKRRRNRKRSHRIRVVRPVGWGKPEFIPTRRASKSRDKATMLFSSNF